MSGRRQSTRAGQWRADALHLARWERQSGSSAGAWLVREIPGLCLMRYGEMWELGALDAAYGRLANRRLHARCVQVWHESWDHQRAQEFIDQLPRKTFATRREAIDAAQQALTGDASQVLSQLLTA